MQIICSYKLKVVWFCMCVYLMVGVLLGKPVSDNLKTGRPKSLCTSLLLSWMLVQSNNMSLVFSKQNIGICF